MDRYINPFVDYGFKKLFATEANKDLLISLLNALIDNPDDPVTDLHYENVEQIGDILGTKNSYFDVVCATKSGRSFIVEMQNVWKPFFVDRNKDEAYRHAHSTIQRTLTLLEQNRFPPYMVPRIRRDVENLIELENRREEEYRKKYGDGWICRFDEVCVVALMDFLLPSDDYPVDSCFHSIELSGVDDHHVFFDKLTLCYVELRKLDDMNLDLTTPRDKWIYALHHLWRYDEYPEELGDGIFQKFFEQAEYARFTPGQQLAYERSEKVYNDTYNEIEGGRILGREEGLEEGRKAGAANTKKEIAKRMKDQGLDNSTIVKWLEITEDELSEILSDAI